jgi:hypothetical protein
MKICLENLPLLFHNFFLNVHMEKYTNLQTYCNCYLAFLFSY